MQGLRSRTAEQAARRKRSTGQIPAEPAAERPRRTPTPRTPGRRAGGPAAAGAGKVAAQVPVAAEAVSEEEQASGAGSGRASSPPRSSIVISMATATAVSLLVYLTDIAKGLGGTRGLQDKLEAVEGGKPQNFLILGSDQRPTDADQGRSDTTILLRIDPEKDVISLFSLPRDLKVNIPGHGIDQPQRRLHLRRAEADPARRSSR